METFYICVSVVEEITPQQGDRIKDGNLLESDVTLSLYKASFLSTNSKNPVRITSKSALVRGTLCLVPILLETKRRYSPQKSRCSRPHCYSLNLLHSVIFHKIQTEKMLIKCVKEGTSQILETCLIQEYKNSLKSTVHQSDDVSSNVQYTEHK